MKTLTSVIVALISVQAFAQGVLLTPAQLPAEARKQLSVQLEAAKKSDPAAFETLAQLRSRLATLDAQKRGRQPAMSPMLRELEGRALFPLISELAFAANPRGELKATAWQAWRVALLEVLGEQRAPIASPIFLAVLSGTETDFEVNRAAASGLGMLGDDATARSLVTLSSGAKREAVLAGMGSCRRLAVAQALAQAVSTTSEPRALASLAKSLGTVGNGWAWQTPGVPAKEEEGAIRSTAARGLVQAFVKGEGAARQAASNALMVVDAAETPALIQQARKIATGGTVTALVALEQRFAKNPARL